MSFRLHSPPGEAAPSEPVEIRSLLADEHVRWSHPALPRAQTWTLLTDGSLLVTAADWSGSAVVRTDGADLVVQSDVFDEVKLPRKLVNGLVLAPREHFQERERLAEVVRTASGNRDEVLLTNDDRLTGELMTLDRGSLTFETDGRKIKLPLSRVVAVIFGDRHTSDASTEAESQAAERDLGPQVLVGLSDGSLLYANQIWGDQDELSVDLAGDVRLTGGSTDDVVFLQSLGGERFVYLSDLEPADYRHVPYLSIAWPYHKDLNVLGEPLSVNGKRYLKGIGIHSAARLTYRLGGEYQRFEAAAAIDESAGGRGSVTFSVYVLRDNEWQEAYKSGIVRGGDSPVPISVDVSGAQGLTLMVDYAERGDELDHADWLDARLVQN